MCITWSISRCHKVSRRLDLISIFFPSGDLQTRSDGVTWLKVREGAPTIRLDEHIRSQADKSGHVRIIPGSMVL